MVTKFEYIVVIALLTSVISASTLPFATKLAWYLSKSKLFKNRVELL